MKNNFYNPGKLLSLKDIRGLDPEIYMVCGNRTAGKTFGFKTVVLKKAIKWKKHGKPDYKFIIIVRYNYEKYGISEEFFKDIGPIKFKDHTLSEKNKEDKYIELYYDDISIGYCISLNSADNIKKFSSNFVDVGCMFMDEFISEKGKYAPKELESLLSIHTSVARGGGKHVRHVPLYMCANMVTILNPYFVKFGIHKRLGNGAKFLRGDGWVLEVTFNESAATALKSSGFMRAFGSDDYVKYATENKFLLDSSAFITKMHGRCSMYTAISHDGIKYGIWMYDESNILYISHKCDPSWQMVFTVNTSDHNEGKILLGASSIFAKKLKQAFEYGSVRFEDMACKNAFMDFVGYTIL